MTATSNSKAPRTDRELSNRILECANLGLPRTDFLQEVSNLLIQFFGCDAVEMWLEEAGAQARCETTRRPKKSFNYRVIERLKGKGAKSTPVSPSDTRRETFCRDVLRGKIGPADRSFARSAGDRY